jgi:hypothetical protein
MAADAVAGPDAAFWAEVDELIGTQSEVHT